MSSGHKMPQDFEQRYFDKIDEGFKEVRREVRVNTRLTQKIDDKVDKVHEQAIKTNGRVNRHDEQINELLSWKNGQKPKKPINLNNKTLTAVAGIIFLVLVLMTRFLGIDLERVFNVG